MQRRAPTSPVVDELRGIQRAHGYLPEGELRSLAQRLQIPLFRLQAVASFYPHFFLRPPARAEVRVCGDMACHRFDSNDLRERLAARSMSANPGQGAGAYALGSVPPRGGSALGLAYGVAGFGAMAAVTLLALRKKFPIWRIGRTQAWMPMETIYDQIGRVREQLLDEADTVVADACGKLQVAVPVAASGANALVSVMRVGADDPAPLREFYTREMRPFAEKPSRGHPLAVAPKTSNVEVRFR